MNKEYKFWIIVSIVVVTLSLALIFGRYIHIIKYSFNNKNTYILALSNEPHGLIDTNYRFRNPTPFRAFLHSTGRIVGNYIIETVYGKITLNNKAEVFLKSDLYTGYTKTIQEIYIKNIPAEKVHTDISIFEFDKATGYSIIAGKELPVSGLILDRYEKLGFFINDSAAIEIDDYEISIPDEGAALYAGVNEWILMDASTPTSYGWQQYINSLSITVEGWYTKSCSEVNMKPEWSRVENYVILEGLERHVVNRFLAGPQTHLGETETMKTLRRMIEEIRVQNDN